MSPKRNGGKPGGSHGFCAELANSGEMWMDKKVVYDEIVLKLVDVEEELKASCEANRVLEAKIKYLEADSILKNVGSEETFLDIISKQQCELTVLNFTAQQTQEVYNVLLAQYDQLEKKQEDQFQKLASETKGKDDKNNKMLADLQKLHKEKQAAVQKVKELSTQLEISKNAKETAIQKMKDLTTQLETSKSAKGSIKMKIKTLETELEASTAKNKDLEDQLSQSKAKVDEIRELQEESDKLRLAREEAEKEERRKEGEAEIEIKEEIIKRLEDELDEWRRKFCDLENTVERVKAIGNGSVYMREEDDLFQKMQEQIEETRQELARVKGEYEQLKIERDNEETKFKVDMLKLNRELGKERRKSQMARIETSFASSRPDCDPQDKQCCDKEMMTDTQVVVQPKSLNKANRKIKKQFTKFQHEIGEIKREKEMIVKQLRDVVAFFKKGGEENKEGIMRGVTKFAKLVCTNQSQQVARLNENWGKQLQELGAKTDKFEKELCRLKKINQNLVDMTETWGKVQGKSNGLDPDMRHALQIVLTRASEESNSDAD